MARLAQSTATLRVCGDDLVPEEITRLLGCPPSSSFAKGDVVRGKNTGREYVKRSGLWRIEANEREPEDLDAQVSELLSRVTQDLSVWADLARRFEIDLFCGLFMQTSNEGTDVSSSTLRALGERGIMLALDVYAPTKEIVESEPCPCGSGRTYGECCMSPTSAGSGP